MHRLLYKYLLLHHKLALPGIGNFVIDHPPSKIDFTEKILQPSVPYIRFSLETQPVDKIFFQFLSKELITDEAQAIQKFNDFLLTIKQQLSDVGNATFSGMGILTKQFSNTYTFTPEGGIVYYLPAVHAERAIRINAGHSVKVGEEEKTSVEMQALLLKEVVKKDFWWLYAIILAVVGVSVILYYKFTH